MLLTTCHSWQRLYLSCVKNPDSRCMYVCTTPTYIQAHGIFQGKQHARQASAPITRALHIHMYMDLPAQRSTCQSLKLGRPHLAPCLHVSPFIQQRLHHLGVSFELCHEHGQQTLLQERVPAAMAMITPNHHIDTPNYGFRVLWV